MLHTAWLLPFVPYEFDREITNLIKQRCCTSLTSSGWMLSSAPWALRYSILLCAWLIRWTHTRPQAMHSCRGAVGRLYWLPCTVTLPEGNLFSYVIYKTECTQRVCIRYSMWSLYAERYNTPTWYCQQPCVLYMLLFMFPPPAPESLLSDSTDCVYLWQKGGGRERVRERERERARDKETWGQISSMFLWFDLIWFIRRHGKKNMLHASRGNVKDEYTIHFHCT